MKRKLNLKELIAIKLGYHIVSKIVFFDEGNYYHDATATIHYKVFENSEEQICVLGETQIKELFNQPLYDASIALSEFKELFKKGVVC